MKKLKCILLLMLISFNIASFAVEYSVNGKQINIYCYAKGDRKIKQPDKGHRTPARLIPCTVSENGIEFAIDADDITGYELWDAAGEICLGVYSDDIDAANHIFTTPGEYQLVIEAGDYYYIGYINSL